MLLSGLWHLPSFRVASVRGASADASGVMAASSSAGTVANEASAGTST